MDLQYVRCIHGCKTEPGLTQFSGMTDPALHNFSSSPVEEVFCSFTKDTKGLPDTLVIHAPYPGWETIRGDLQRLISVEPSVATFTRYALRYTDRFHPGDHLSGTFKRDDIQDRIIGTSGDDIEVTTDIPGTKAFLRYTPDDTYGHTLTFTFQGDSSRVSADEMMTWFDAAHAGIHILFDLCVPEEIIRILR